MSAEPLVSVGVPIYNAEDTIEAVVKSVLAQDHENLELVITDNASTDGTEDVCRELARADERINYLRRPVNIGIVANFDGAIQIARGTYFRWLGDDDWIDPTYVSRCLRVLTDDPELLLVTTQLRYALAGGASTSATYRGTRLGSADPSVRFAEIVHLMTAGFAVLDPIYSMMRRERVAALPRREMLRGDEVFAARMALAGPWGHIPEVLAGRGWADDSLSDLAVRLGVPRWQGWMATAIECRELLAVLVESDLSSSQARRARATVRGLYLTRLSRAGQRGWRKAVRFAGAVGRNGAAGNVIHRPSGLPRRRT